MQYYVYILANRKNGTLYTGMTNDLVRRTFEHKQRLANGFTKKHGVKNLVYFEAHEDVRQALQRERNLKRWRRAWKIDLIERQNPNWQDLYDTITQ